MVTLQINGESEHRRFTFYFFCYNEKKLLCILLQIELTAVEANYDCNVMWQTLSCLNVTSLIHSVH